MAKSKAIEVKMNKARDTKGTFVYKNEDADTAVPSLYIKKAAFKGDAPENIVITIEEA